MLLLLGCAFATAAMGTLIYFAAARRRVRLGALRRGHRLLGILVALSTAAFTFSGSYHLLQMSRQPAPGASPRQVGFDVAELRHPLSALAARFEGMPIRQVSTARIGEAAFYRIERALQSTSSAGGHAHGHIPPDLAAPQQKPPLIDAAGGAALENGNERYLASLVRHFSGSAEVPAGTAITRFGGEYGFVFKRLPVERFEPSEGVRYYVEPATATLAARIDDADAREGWIFAYLHKFEWLPPGTARDIAAVSFASANGLVAILGIVLFLRRQRVRPRARQWTDL
jgi:hypothetical protein